MITRSKRSATSRGASPAGTGKLLRYGKHLTLFWGTVFIALTLSCTNSRELTRSNIADLIRSSEDFIRPVSVPLPGKREWPTEERSTDEPEQEAKRRAIDEYAKTSAEIAAFHHLGLIDFRATPVEEPTPTYKWWRFELEPVLTEKGQAESIDSPENKRLKEIVIARRELVEVTGITTPKAGTAQVEFTWKQEPTPAGEAFDSNSETYKSFPEWLRQLIAGQPGGFGRSAERKYGDIRKGKAFLQLYDDGWRVKLIQF